MASSPIPHQNTTTTRLKIPADGHHNHQSIFADQGGEVRYRVPLPIVDIKCSRVHCRKGVWSPIG